MFLWAYYKLTGRNLQGEPLDNAAPRRLRDDGAQAVLKYILCDPSGPLYVMQPEHPEYVRQTLATDPEKQGTLFRRVTFAIRSHLIDDIFLQRVKEIALADPHLASHIEASVGELEQQHVEAVISIDDQLAAVRLEIDKTLAFLHDKILTLTPKDKAKYNDTLEGLRERERALSNVPEQSEHVSLKADFEELSDLLTDVPGKLDGSTMAHKQKLARLITESVKIEEVSVHWLRLTVVWRGPLADRPDVCLIWRQRGKRSEEWITEEDEYIRTNYPDGDKWTMLEDLPRRNWNMIYQRALFLGVHRTAYRHENITENITVDDLNVIPERALALEIVAEVSRQRSKQEFQAYGVWLCIAS